MTTRDAARRRRWITRRGLLQAGGTMLAGATLAGGYALGIEPFREKITTYALTPPRWPTGFKLRVVALADLHICEPWTGVRRLERIIAHANALSPDVIVLLGDYVPGVRIGKFATAVPPTIWGPMLAQLKAPAGVHAVLGNHDWWEDAVAQRLRKGPTEAHRALADNGIIVHENTAVRLTKLDKGGKPHPFWIAGLGDQWAFFGGPRFNADGSRNLGRYRGVDDLDATTRALSDDAPAILLVHEPDIFPRVPERYALTFAGHTHGGQVRLFGYAPIVPSRYRNRYVHGHIVEERRNLIVSSGLGVSGLPVRFGAAPEIVVVDFG